MRYVKTFSKIAKQKARCITTAVFALADVPRPPGAIQLAGGNGELRIRIGNYRVIYTVDNGQLVVLVIELGHRREVYR